MHRTWLTETEEQIANLPPCDESPEGVATLAPLVAALADRLQRQAPLVEQLADCVLVVDLDSNADNG